MLAAGAVLIVVGVIVGVTAPTETSFGWSAYAPLSQGTFSGSGNPLLVPRQLAIAAALVAVGLITLAFCAGWALGRRRRS